MRAPSWLPIALLVACGGGKGDDTYEDGVTDEGDADTDADSDADTDPESTGDTGTLAGDCYADYAFDVDVDGTIEVTGVDVHDPVETDRIVHLERDGDPAGAPPDGVTDTMADYAYDANGNLASYVLKINTGPPVGVLTYFEDRTWDLATNQVLTLEADCVLEGAFSRCFDGAVDYGETSTYDADGNLTSFAIDDDFDGAADFLEARTYDADGREIRLERDEDGDGAADYVLSTSYDPASPPLFADQEEDRDGDGTIDAVIHFDLDASDRVVQLTVDDGGDGVIDVRSVYDYTDPVLLSGTYSEDDGDDGVVDLVETFESDASGNLLFFAQDTSPGDGVDDFTYTWTFDAASGQQLTEAFADLSGQPGARDYRIEVTLDAQARVVGSSYVETVSASGAVAYEQAEDWIYGGSCP